MIIPLNYITELGVIFMKLATGAKKIKKNNERNPKSKGITLGIWQKM